MSAPHRIAVLPGDGIGPEVTRAAVQVLRAVQDRYGHPFEFREGLIGGIAIDELDTPLPQETVALCEWSDAALFGAVGGPRWDHLPWERNPGPGGLLKLRRDFDLFANVRPVRSYVPEKMRVKSAKVDLVFVREATGGAYFSAKRGRQRLPDGQEYAFDTMEYSTNQVRRAIAFACRLARTRSGKVASVDKANVLDSSKLWREVAKRTFAEHPELSVEHVYVDNFALQLILRPEEIDVIVTENLFGDILSDEAAGLVGTLGLLPSASLRDDGWGLYEPIHGAAPDIAGRDIANPTAAILSAALMLKHSLGMPAAAEAVEDAVRAVLDRGVRTPDLAHSAGDAVGTVEFGERVAEIVAACAPNEDADADGADADADSTGGADTTVRSGR
jgi:3-isopropylmalate dehydrogenase